MPEGVEVKISVDLIKPLVHGKRIADLDTFTSSRYGVKDPEGFAEFKKLATGANSITIEDVASRGKLMYWSFSNDWHMLCTFGMTGQWSPTKGNHPCLIVRYIDEGWKDVFFNDPRHFGTIKFVNSYAKMNAKRSSLGWDALHDGANEQWLNYVGNTLARSTKPIGQVLMDQGVFAGVGNYIRAEALYLAKMSPWRQSNLLKKEDIRNLCQAIIEVMNDSYAHQGATILTYKDAYGAEGKYSSCFKVYGQKTDPLGNKIVKENTPDGRAMHWCPAVQT